MRLYVVNVGVNTADATRRGLKSPVFSDGTFEFVPIKEPSRFADSRRIPSYFQLRSWTGRAKSLSDFLPARLAYYKAHADPEFNTFTYGDILSPRAANLQHLFPKDQLWFLARLWDHDGENWTGASDFYFIGYFVVSLVTFVWKGMEPDKVPTAVQRKIQSNAHWLRLLDGDRSGFLVANGFPAKSKRFQKALRVTPEVAGLIYGGNYHPATGLYKAGSQILRNKNGKPRRFETFGSVTRSIQPFLD